MSSLRASPPEKLPFAGGADANASAAVATHAPRLPGAIWSPRFVRILIAQTTFSFGWSLYLLAPKYFAIELGADARTVGQLSAMGGLFTVATIPLLARGIDRLGGKTFFAGACGLLLLVSAGFMYVRELGPSLYVLHGLVATACVLAFNAGATLATEEVPASRMGEAIGVFGASNMVMNGISTWLGEKVAAAAGWDRVFALSMLAAGAALTLCLSHREKPRPAAPASRHAEEARSSTVSTFSLGLLLAITMLLGGVFSAMFVFSQPYALSLGAREVNDFFLGFTAIAVATRAFLGHLGDCFGRVRISLGASVLYTLSAASMTLLGPHSLAAHGALFGLAHGVIHPTLNAVLIERVGFSQRGRAMTLYTGAFNAGTAVSGLGWGLVAQASGYRAVYLGATLLCILATAGLLRVSRTAT